MQATLLTGTEGTRLLDLEEDRRDHAIKVVASGGDGGLAALNYDPDGVMNLEEEELAKNVFAEDLRLPGRELTNTVSDAIEGVTINLLRRKRARSSRSTSASTRPA